MTISNMREWVKGKGKIVSLLGMLALAGTTVTGCGDRPENPNEYYYARDKYYESLPENLREEIFSRNQQIHDTVAEIPVIKQYYSQRSEVHGENEEFIKMYIAEKGMRNQGKLVKDMNQEELDAFTNQSIKESAEIINSTIKSTCLYHEENIARNLGNKLNTSSLDTYHGVK